MATDSTAKILAIAALQAGQLDESITVTQAVGGIPAGTVYPEDTSLATIIKDLLQGSTPVVTATIYYGAKDNPPTSISGLTAKTVSESVLVGTYLQHITAGDTTTQTSQYPILAIPDNYIVTKWYVSGFEVDIPHTLVNNGGYNIYYLNTPSYDVDEGGIDYLFNIEKVETPVTTVVYSGATDNPPTDLTGLTATTVRTSALVGTYSHHITAGDATARTAQYPVFAVEDSYSITKWYVSGFEFDIPHTMITQSGYHIYYLDVPSYDVEDGGIDYKFDVEES